jgi:uncharacterized protein (TIGR02996 family)
MSIVVFIRVTISKSMGNCIDNRDVETLKRGVANPSYRADTQRPLMPASKPAEPMPAHARDASANPVAVARGAAARGAFAEARDALVDAWRIYRSPTIADLVDLLEAEYPSPRQAELAEVVRPTARESLARLERLPNWDDPRVSRFAMDRLAALPFTTPNAHAFLDRLIDVVEAAGDARLLGRAANIASSLRVRVTRAGVRDGLLRHLDTVVTGLTPPAPLPLDLASDLQALEALLAPLGASSRLGESLLESIYAEPDDDLRRVVYGDWLVARGDARGELIQLQLQRRAAAPAPDAVAREVALLKMNGRRWLGPLGSVLSFGPSYSSTTFERGFVSTADIILSVGKKLTPLLAEPSWATVEHLIGWYTLELVEQAPLRALRSLGRSLSPENVRALARRAEPLRRVEMVSLDRPTEHASAELRRAFPALRQATITAILDPDEMNHAVALEVPHTVVPLGRYDDAPARARWDALTTRLLELSSAGPQGRSVELKLWRGRGSIRRVFRAAADQWIQEPDARSADG